LEAFLTMAALIGLLPSVSAVHKADHGAAEVPYGASDRN
jgi:hypothetical protein